MQADDLVHPHACGEYVAARLLFQPRGGSPPRLWGILIAQHPLQLRTRFTPTPVGNTLSSTGRRWCIAVHPHACGEYLQQGIRFPRFSGSPPRLWGILRQDRPYAWCTRFTPTPVGNTPSKSR